MAETDDKKAGDQVQAYTKIQRLDGEKRVIDVLKMTSMEFEELVSKYSAGKHSEQKYIPFSVEDAHRLAKADEELAVKGHVKTNGFEETIVFLMSLTQAIWKTMQKHESFRMELFYNAQTLNTNYCIFAPTDKHVLDDKYSEFSKGQD